jgi:hypothetical protein
VKSRTLLTTIGVGFLSVVGCDSGERIRQLEKQNEELKEQIKKEQAVADYDFQAKCGKDAKTWFNEGWPSDKDTILLTYTNHYNKVQNKCFILIEYHYRLDTNGSWANSLSLWDLYENAQYGTFGEQTVIHWKPTYGSEKVLGTCELLDKKCKTAEEFNDLVRPYLSN